MTREIKKYSVTVFHQSYTLRSDESEDQICQAAQLVNNLMTEIEQGSQGLELSKIAVLAALKLANTVVSGKYQVERNQQCIKDLISKIEPLL